MVLCTHSIHVLLIWRRPTENPGRPEIAMRDIPATIMYSSDTAVLKYQGTETHLLLKHMPVIAFAQFHHLFLK